MHWVTSSLLSYLAGRNKISGECGGEIVPMLQGKTLNISLRTQHSLAEIASSCADIITDTLYNPFSKQIIYLMYLPYYKACVFCLTPIFP